MNDNDETNKRVNAFIDAATTHVRENGAIDNRTQGARKRAKHVGKDPVNKTKQPRLLTGLPVAKRTPLPKGNFVQTARNDSNTRLILRTFIKGEQMAWITFNKLELGRLMSNLHQHFVEMVNEIEPPKQ